MKFNYAHRGHPHALELLPTPDGFQAINAEESHQLRVLQANVGDAGDLLFEVDGRQQRVRWAREGRQIWLHMHGRTYLLEKTAGASSASAAGQSTESVLRAPMPGQLRELLVAQGDTVASGDLLMLLEAMKMEIRIQAPRAGRIAHMQLAAGDFVEKDQILVELEDLDETDEDANKEEK